MLRCSPSHGPGSLVVADPSPQQQDPGAGHGIEKIAIFDQRGALLHEAVDQALAVALIEQAAHPFEMADFRNVGIGHSKPDTADHREKRWMLL